MAIWNGHVKDNQKTVVLENKKKHEPIIDDVLDELEEITEVLANQTKLISELMAEIKALGQQNQELTKFVKEAVRVDVELHTVKTHYYDMVKWMQERFIDMLGLQASAPKVSKAMQDYIDRKSTVTPVKLP